MVFNSGKTTPLSAFDQAVFDGNAYKVSTRRTLADTEELIIHIDPVAAGGNVVLEAPRVNPEDRADYDVFENADPGANLVDDLEVHNMDYDSQETPEATVQRVSSGGLDTTNADQTEETLIDQDSNDLGTAAESSRTVYRNVPPEDVISLIITDRSGGQNNDYGFDLTIYEGDTLPE